MTFSEIRKLKYMTQEVLAEKVGVSQSAVAAWETGVAKPTLNNLILLSKVLNEDISVIAESLSTLN